MSLFHNHFEYIISHNSQVVRRAEMRRSWCDHSTTCGRWGRYQSAQRETYRETPCVEGTLMLNFLVVSLPLRLKKPNIFNLMKQGRGWILMFLFIYLMKIKLQNGNFFAELSTLKTLPRYSLFERRNISPCLFDSFMYKILPYS